MPRKNWFSISAKADDSAEIRIHDEIGGWGITARDFMASLAGLPESVKQINLSVHSPGGSVLDGWAVYNAIKAHPARVVATVEGLAASMASVVIQAADEIRMPANTWLMVHYPRAVAAGNADEMESIAETLRKIEAGIVRVYQDSTGLPEEEIREMLAKETYMDGKEAVEKGFATTLLAEQKAAAVDRAWLDQFSAVPTALRSIEAMAERKPSPPTKTEKETTMNGNTAAPVAAPTAPEAPHVSDPEKLRAEIERERTSERSRIRAIESIGTRFSLDQGKIDAAIDGGLSIDAFRAQVMDSYQPEAVAPGGATSFLNAGPREKREYSVVRAIFQMATEGKLSGFEGEVQQELSARFEDATGEAPRGIILPGEVTHGRPGNSGRADRIRAAQTAGTATEGGHTVQTDYGPLIDYLEEFSLAPRLGCTFLRDLTGNVKFPRASSGYTATWDAETDTISATDAVFGETTLSPKRVGGGTNVSLQLLRQSSVDIEGWVRGRLARNIATAIDRAVFTGAGGDAPTGLLAASGTTAYAMGSGASLLDDVAAIWGDLRGAHVPMVSATWVSTPVTTENWMTTAKTQATGDMVLTGDPTGRQSVLGYPYYDHTDITSNKVIFGEFSYVLVGLWGGIDLVVDPYSAKSSGQVQIFANAYADTDLEQAAGFVITSNAGTAHLGSQQY